MIRHAVFHCILLCILIAGNPCHGKTVFHWSFDGALGEQCLLETDSVSGVALHAVRRPGVISDVRHGRGNPWFNSKATSVEFDADCVWENSGAVLAGYDPGTDTALDLSTQTAFTIEFFYCPFSLKDCTLVGKAGSNGGFAVEQVARGGLRFSVNGDQNALSFGPGVIRQSQWYHVAATYEAGDIAAPMKLYLNGELMAAGGSGGPVRDSTYAFAVGARTSRNDDPPVPGGTKSYFFGRIDELRISDTALVPGHFLVNEIRTKARLPYPEDGAEQFSRTTHLTWQPAAGVQSQRVYFGTNPDRLQLIMEVGPDVARVENTDLGGRIEKDTTCFWRVDSQGTEDENGAYSFAQAGRGELWSFTTQGDMLKPGYVRWLLHLGQSPSDRVLSSIGHIDQLEAFGGESNVRPRPNEIFDFPGPGATTPQMMIWTPQYSSTGFFTHDPTVGSYLHYYHVYVISPDRRSARLSYRSHGHLKAWGNGSALCDEHPPYYREGTADLALDKGANALLFKICGNYLEPYNVVVEPYLAVRITDPNGNTFTDLTYSLEPPVPQVDVRVTRELPPCYLPGSPVEVVLHVRCDNTGDPGEFQVIETVPEGLAVLEAGDGQIDRNTIWWMLRTNEVPLSDLRYRLAVPADHTGMIPFLGYTYHDKRLDDIVGEAVLFNKPPVSPVDMVDQLETVEIDPYKYLDSNHVTLGAEEYGPDQEGSLVAMGRGLLQGLKPYKTGGWAEYAFSVEHAGVYRVIIDYGELWTMFHHTAPVDIFIDGSIALHADLPPTTHSYQPWSHSNIDAERPWIDPERKAKWIVGDVYLDPGAHTLRLEFPAFCGPDVQLDWRNDGRPVVTRIILTNHPGLAVPGLAEPHHVDSYEHAPACLVHDRDITTLPDGRVEMTIYGTFYSLSQGNELYFVDGSFMPRPGNALAKFQIVSFEPQVFHLPPEGEQDFALTVCSTEAVPEDYSELAVVWLQGTPSAPSRKPYLFTTARTYVRLPSIAQERSPSNPVALFPGVPTFMGSSGIPAVTDDPKELIPDRFDLGFQRGRYALDIEQFFEQQLWGGHLPSVEQAFQMLQWDDTNYGFGYLGMGQIWSHIIASPYSRLNLAEGQEFIRRLSETLVFYPVSVRWDWSRPEYLPPFNPVDYIRGVPALTPHIRCAQEGLVDDAEQFKVLHNLVLPVFTSSWDQLRSCAVLTEDANAGETAVFIDRRFYGKTGSSTNGFTGYLLVGSDCYRKYRPDDEHKMVLMEPLRASYPKGTLVTSWSFVEDNELECLDINSLLWIAAASRDPAVVDQIVCMVGEILNKQNIFWPDGSFRNEPGSYGNDAWLYPNALVSVRRLYGTEVMRMVSKETLEAMCGYLINTCRFAFSSAKIPMLNGGGSLNQLDRAYCGNRHLLHMLETLFPEQQEIVGRYRRVFAQEEAKVAGTVIDNENWVIHGYGYAMLRSENHVWDRRMETLLSSKHLLQDPGDHVSRDCLGIVVYGLGAILTPRYGYSWVGYLPPFLNQVMIDEAWQNHENHYYGSFRHFDGREELPSAVAHTGDGDDCSQLDYDMSRWCIQFPEYLFDAYFIEAKDPNMHQYDWSLINMGEMEIVEPKFLAWEPCPQFLDGYWPTPGTQGGGSRTTAAKGPGRVVVDWHVSNRPWVANGDSMLLRFTPVHSGRLRLIAADDSPSSLIDAQIGFHDYPDLFQANSQDILVIRKLAASHVFIDTLEPIAEDEQAYVRDVVVVAKGSHQQRLAKIATAEGEDWVYLSGQWGSRPDGDRPLDGIETDADIVAWRIKGGIVTRLYLANGSYARTSAGHWQFEAVGNHYVGGQTE